LWELGIGHESEILLKEKLGKGVKLLECGESKCKTFAGSNF